MDWLNDKKNMPIILTVVGVIVVAVGVFFYMHMTGSNAGENVTASQTAPSPMPAAGTPGATTASTTPAPPAPGAPPATGQAANPPGVPSGVPPTAPGAGGAKGTQVAAVQPMETWRNDPFLPVGYKPPPAVHPKPRIADFPFPPPGKYVPPGPPKEIQEPPQPARRMSGILLNDRVYAIIEENGSSYVVQPGFRMPDGLATVEKIEADRCILKTTGPHPRYIVVRMAGAPPAEAGPSAPSSAPTIGESIRNRLRRRM